MSKDPHSVEEVVSDLEDIAEEQDEVSFGDLLDKFGSRSFGPFFIILPLIEITPIGAIPGVPTALATLIALIALQLLFGRDHIWMPGFVENRKLSSEKLTKGLVKLEKPAEVIDKPARGRLEWLTKGNGQKLAALCIIILCASVPFLEVLPFASMLPMLAIALFGLAIIVRDGLLMLLGVAATAGAAVWAFSTLFMGSGG